MNYSSLNINKENRAPEILILLILMLIFYYLYIYRLDNPVLWQDEIFTANYIKKSYAFLTDTDRAGERHPPGHYIALKAWTEFFGADRFGVRSLSVAWAMICLPLIYAIVRLRLDGRTALIAVVALAVFPGFVHYAREARMYGQIFGLLLLASFFFLFLFSRFQRLGSLKRIILTIAFSIFLAGTFYTHYISGVFFVCFFFASIAMALYQRNFGFLAYAIAGLALATLIILPQFLHMLDFVDVDEDEWISATNIIVFYSAISGAYDAPKLLKPFIYLSYLAGLLILWRNDKELLIFASTFLIIGPLLLALIGIVRPVLLVRTLQPFTLFAPLLLALAVTRIPWPRVGVAIGLLAAAANLQTFSRDFPAQRQDLFVEQAAFMLSSVSSPFDRVFYIEHLQQQFDFMNIDQNGFSSISFDNIERDSFFINDHIDNCTKDFDCDKVLVILEKDPRFEKLLGERWIDFVQNLRPDEFLDIGGYIVYVFNFSNIE